MTAFKNLPRGKRFTVRDQNQEGRESVYYMVTDTVNFGDCGTYNAVRLSAPYAGILMYGDREVDETL